MFNLVRKYGLALAVFSAAAIAAAPASAQHGGGSHGGGGYHGGGGWHGGHGWHHGWHGGWGWGWGVGIGFYDPWWPGYYGYGYSPYYYPYYSEPSVTVLQQAPAAQAAPAASWYYCDNPAGYYPYVQTCSQPWRPVAPTPPPNSAPHQ